ncbi:AtaL-like protein [Geomonas sp.]|uniref:AtaL-like protein n=1 Tax=Geomonas sp. TaxID=2651584 RepID=UPI002B46C487|nr:AtaL-like protein [Geomonas sp.]HJV33730.1 AtaL-like protein [Geomonas sp.]
MPMIVKTLQVLVHAEHETLWKILMDRLENPGRYLPGVSEANILERNEGEVVREMKLHGDLVKERIMIRPHGAELRHELLEHPQFTGFIVTKIVRTAVQSPVAPQYLEYDLDLQTKSFKVDGAVQGEDEIIGDIKYEMAKLKSRAEEMDSRA